LSCLFFRDHFNTAQENVIELLLDANMLTGDYGLKALLACAAIAILPSLAFFPGLACAPRDRIKKQIPASKPAPWAPGKKSGGYLKTTKPYTIMGTTYYPLADAYGYEKIGVASWYGRKFHGRPTASGETYNMYGISAAHKTLPLGTVVEVTRLDTNKKIVVRINDRGPFVATRIIDLSYGAARRLGMADRGTAKVRVVALARGRPGPRGGAPVAVKPPPNFSKGRFWVQVGAFSVRDNAEKVRERLLFPVEKIRLEPYKHVNGDTLTRVRIGPFTDIDVADEALASADRQGFDTAFVVAE